MIKRLSSVKTPSMIDSSNHGHVSVKEDPLVTICHEGGSVGKVSIVSQKLRLRHKSAVIVRANEGISHQPVQRLRIVMQLCLVPAIFQRNQQSLVPVGGGNGILSIDQIGR